MTENHPASFRDPHGYVIIHKNKVYRFVGKQEQENYDQLMDGGLYDDLVKSGLLIQHKELSLKDAKTIMSGGNEGLYKIIQPETVKFISYPYEWSFGQLKDAALLTLKIMKYSLQKEMVLKDASAYNVQFNGPNPVFIDTTSFEQYSEKPWDGYKQFCQHFLAPLALQSYGDQYLHRISRIYIDGVPLSIAAKLLPMKSKLNIGILQHIHLHSKSQKMFDNQGSEHIERGKEKRDIPKMPKFQLLAIIDSLERTVSKLSPTSQDTEWGEYYTFTNYSKKSFSFKHKAIEKLVKKVKPKSTWDLGANNGEFSVIAANNGSYTMAFDIDPIAVNSNYERFKEQKSMLPLLLDLTNPSPAIGWGLKERESIIDRGPADLVMALALIHHLSIGNNVPFPRVAEFLAKCGKNLIIEFVPKGDSKVDSLLTTRKDIFDSYTVKNFEDSFKEHFTIKESIKIPESKRVLYLMKRK